MASWVLVFISARPFSSSILSRWRRAFVFSLASSPIPKEDTKPTEAGREGEFLLLMLWEKGSGFRRRVVGGLCQSPFADWRLTRLRTQLWGGSQRRPTIFRGVVAGSVNPGAGISDAGLQLQGQRVSTRRTKMKLLINVS